MSGGGLFIPTGSGGTTGGTTGTVPTAAEIADAIETKTGDNMILGQSIADGRTLIMVRTASNGATSVFEADGVTPASVADFQGPNSSVSSVFGQSNLDSRKLLMRENSATGATEVFEFDGITPAAIAEFEPATQENFAEELLQRMPNFSSETNTKLVPVASYNVPDPAARTFTPADLYALVTGFNATTERMAIAEVSFTPLFDDTDVTLEADLTLTFASGPAWTITKGTTNQSFGADGHSPAELEDWSLEVPANNGVLILSTVLKTPKFNQDNQDQ